MLLSSSVVPLEVAVKIGLGCCHLQAYLGLGHLISRWHLLIAVGLKLQFLAVQSSYVELCH